jgi:single-stranded DNA-specific DHH superfamily exonuclease
MALPSAYSDATIGAFMVDELGPVATTLGWTYAGGSFNEAINDLLVLAGLTAIADVAVGKARALARVAVWRRVVSHTAGDFAFSADGASFNRNQFHEQARARLIQVEADAGADGYLGAYQITTEDVAYINDPYHRILGDDNDTGINGPVVFAE